ncbi:MAG: ABC transporter ATP-binding protein [Deltaproteobacteria bacterium]|nr:ABC transporter ATP-binding protein [Deltaproteobacteria bacterium]
MNGRSNSSLLTVHDLHAHYGKSHILRGVDFQVGAGEIVSLLGRNGSGRSTTLKSIMGLVVPSAGKISLRGKDLTGARSFTICRAGIGYVPEEREIFTNLTVDENLRMGEQPPAEGASAWTVEQMFDYFPNLRERRKTKAGNISGGEQQMLTICRSLLGNPKVLLIDEPTEGLAPLTVSIVEEAIRDIHLRGVSIVLVEQKLAIALKVSSHVCVMGHGQIVFEGTPEELINNPDLLKKWLAV